MKHDDQDDHVAGSARFGNSIVDPTSGVHGMENVTKPQKVHVKLHLHIQSIRTVTAMGASSSKAARGTARKFPTRPPPSAVSQPVARARAAPATELGSKAQSDGSKDDGSSYYQQALQSI
jgi:hypothetical protein